LNQNKPGIGSFLAIILILFLFIVGSVFAKSKIKQNNAFTLSVKGNVVQARVKSVDLKKSDGYTKVKIPGLMNYARPGQPLLPIKTVKYLIPQDQEIEDVEVNFTSRKIIPGIYYVEPAQQPLPLSYKGRITRTMPDSAIYNSVRAFPGKQYEISSIQFKRGYKIAIINIFPVEYIPATGMLSYFENLSLNIKLRNSKSSPHNIYRGISADRQAVGGFVDNPDALALYPQNKITPLASDAQYLIITSDTFAAYSGTYDLSALIAHKQSKWSLTTKIVDKTGAGGWGTYAGADDPERIRNCIFDNYKNHGTQYVLLVGDSDGNLTDTPASGERQAWNDANRIPHRGLFGNEGSYTDNSIPSDIYYACLDSDDGLSPNTFNNDADAIYGENTDGPGGGDIDLLAEVYVGRLPVDSTSELENCVKKIIAYENSASGYLNRALMVGEQLDPWTYGGDYMEEIKNGSSANGYTTRGLAGSGYFSFSSLYEKASDWTTADLSSQLNNGVHILNHLGHAAATLFGKEFSPTDADNLTNTDYFFGYTQGCYSGAYDNKNSEGGYELVFDCMLEHFITESSGAFAFIGNTRYGWYMSTNTDGPSQRYNREFWDAVVYEGKTHLGEALEDSKEDNVGLVNSYGAYRWCYFEISLLGDPQTPLQGEFLSPTDFSATNICVGNNSWVNLNWKNSNSGNIQQTMIRYRTDGIYPTSETDGTLLCTRAAVPGAEDMFSHTSVQAGTTYNYVAFGYNGSSYEGQNSLLNRASVTVIGGNSAASTGRSDCFVATVCYQDGNAPEVKALRKFRDKILKKSYQGKEFIAWYYAFGPKLAGWIKKRDCFKNFLRVYLDPAAKSAKFLTGDY